MTSRQSALLAMGCTAVLLATGIGLGIVSWRARPSRGGTDLAAPRPADLPAPAPVEHRAYRRAYELDPGTIRVCVRNLGTDPLAFRRVRLDGIEIPVWGVESEGETTMPERAAPGTADRAASVAPADLARTLILWARMSPSEIPPGGVGEFAAKLHSPMPRPMKVELFPVDGEPLSCVVRPVEPPLAITAVAFPEGSPASRMYVYLEGRSAQPLALRGLECDGQWAAEGLWLSASTLSEGEKALAVVELDPPREQGAAVALSIFTRDGPVAAERIRVFPGLPVNAEGGSTPDGFGLDPEPYNHRPAYVDPKKGAAPPHATPKPTLRANDVFHCAMHAYGLDKHRTAREILRRHDLCRRHDPHHPSVQHLCRIRPETGYALFGQLTDAMRINPNIRTSLDPALRQARELEAVAGITRAARLAVRPRLVHAVADTAPFGQTKGYTDPATFRRRVYAILSQCPDAVLYRHRGWAGKDDHARAVNAEIRRLNAELARLRPHLAVADVWPWPSAPQRPDLLARALLAGDQALILLLIRRPAKEGEPSPGGDTLTLTLDLPDTLVPRGAARITPDGPAPLADPVARDGGLSTLDVPLPDVAAACIVHLGRDAR